MVGPFVVPGRTACLRCVDAHHTDADPAWPLLVRQYAAASLARPRRRRARAGRPAARRARASPGRPATWRRTSTGGRPSTWSATVTLHARPRPTLETRAWLRHPALRLQLGLTTASRTATGLSGRRRTQWGRMTELPRKAVDAHGPARGAAARATPAAPPSGIGQAASAARPAEAVLTEVQQRTAEQLFKTLGELKGGAMKFGQALSIFEAALPEELARPTASS